MKKYLLFIVEGNNDKREMQAILRAACPKAIETTYVDEYIVFNGDITTESDSNEKTIVGKLNKLVVSWRNGDSHPFQRIVPSDVFKIIHIIDADGVFIPEDSIVQKEGEVYIKYYDDHIEFDDRSRAIGRNRKKASIIRKMLTITQVDNIPYEVYFASCNMDHVLFNERNPLQKQKNQRSFEFASRCKTKADLQNTIYSQEVCEMGSFDDSWECLQWDYNSLCRHTNLNLLLDILE